MSAAAVVKDPRRITEADPDFLRVRAHWQRLLLASVRQLQREIAAAGEHAIAPAQSAFIHRHIQLLREAYVAGHAEGQRDYWDEVSLTPEKWARERRVPPTERLIQRRLLFYAAASVVKLAREVAALWKSGHTIRAQKARALGDPPADLAFNKFTAWASPRIGLQADITWSGFQDGYLDAATADQAGLRLQLWWELEPAAQHCDDCPEYAAGSPYDAPGSGGNELDATPGDGHTQCGASCKCSLRYGWTDMTRLSAAGPGANPRDYELLIPPSQTPGPDAWEQNRQAQIAEALAKTQPSVQPGVPPSQDAWEQNRQRQIAEALQSRPPESGVAQPGDVWEQSQQAWQSWIDKLRAGGQIDTQHATGQLDTTVAEVGGHTSITRDFVRVMPGASGNEPSALANLNVEQKAALDDIRGIALLWDATRGQLPDFEVYFDPGSASNLWQNPRLVDLNRTQRELVLRYFRALRNFADASPLIED